MEVGRWKTEVGRQKLGDRSWEMEVGRWKSEDGSRKTEAGRWKPEDGWKNAGKSDRFRKVL
jgi:hypothetical protein